jgi:hypothetical protein
MFKFFLKIKILISILIIVNICYAIDFHIGYPDPKIFYGKFRGFGAEWDPFFWNTNNQNRGCNQSGWDIITNRLKEMKVSIMRIMMQLYWCQTSPDLTNWTWTTAQMQSVFKYLDFCQQNNIDVILNDWGWSVWQLYSSPTDIRYARGMAEYLKEFIERRGYTCIKYFIVGNEPDNDIAKNYGMNAYVTMYRNIDQALKENGLRNKIMLTGPDMGGDWAFFKNAIDSLHDILDGYDFHRYADDDQTSNYGKTDYWDTTRYCIDLWRDEVNSRDPNGVNKYIIMTEMGLNDGASINTNTNIDTFLYAIHMADYGTTLLSSRLQGGSAWCVHDVYYFDGNQYMRWGMWKYVTDNWNLRPWSQTWPLLIKYAPRNSVQAPINGTPPDTPPISMYRCAAVKRPDGGWSIFLVNRTSSELNANIILPHISWNTFTYYRVDKNTFSSYPNTIYVPPVNTLPASDKITINIPAESFNVLVENTAGTPVININKTTLDFGEIKIGETKTLSFTITNSNDGILFGTISAGTNWIKTDTTYFEGNNVTVNVTVDNTILNQYEQQFTGTLNIESNGGNTNITIVGTATCVLTKPNPYNPNKGLLTFYGSGIVPDKTTIKIYTLSGELVKTLYSPIISADKIMQEITWDGKNEDGYSVTSGIYLYTYMSPKEKGTGKFTIITK